MPSQPFADGFAFVIVLINNFKSTLEGRWATLFGIPFITSQGNRHSKIVNYFKAFSNKSK